MVCSLKSILFTNGLKMYTDLYLYPMWFCVHKPSSEFPARAVILQKVFSINCRITHGVYLAVTTGWPPAALLNNKSQVQLFWGLRHAGLHEIWTFYALLRCNRDSNHCRILFCFPICCETHPAIFAVGQELVLLLRVEDERLWVEGDGLPLEGWTFICADEQHLIPLIYWGSHQNDL